MAIDSKIFLKEEVVNKDRAFGSCDVYYPTYVVLIDGKEVPALFTLDQLRIAMARASRNTEDIPKKSKNFFDWLLG